MNTGGNVMAKDVINVDGKDVVVREDTAKAFRGVNWAIASIGIFVVIVAILFFTFFMRSATDGHIDNASDPVQRGSNTR